MFLISIDFRNIPIAEDFAATAVRLPGGDGVISLSLRYDPADPIIQLFERYLATEAASDRLDAPIEALRAALAERARTNPRAPEGLGRRPTWS